MAEQEDNHFVAHPEGGITTASQVEAEKAKAPEVQSEEAAPEVASASEVAASPEVQPEEQAAPETSETEPEATTVEPEAEQPAESAEEAPAAE